MGPWCFVHLDSPTDAMDLVEDGVGKGTCFCKGSPASKLVNCQDVVPPSPAFGLAQHSRNGVSARNGGIVDGNETKTRRIYIVGQKYGYQNLRATIDGILILFSSIL